MAKIDSNVAARILQLEKMEISVDQIDQPKVAANVNYQRGELQTGAEEVMKDQPQKVVDQSGRELKVESVQSNKEKVGRNDLCPCGSGKKYKIVTES
jgi:preprotein translocase subunit SecA